MFVGKLLEKARTTGCNADGATSQVVQGKLQCTNGHLLYRTNVGSLRYPVHTRPNISLVVGFVSRFMDTPKTKHMSTVKHILRYIAGNLHHNYRSSNNKDTPLTGYNDDDLVDDVTTGVIFFLGQCPIT